MSAPQPPKAEAYTAPSNPATRNPAEDAAASESHARDAVQGRAPIPQTQSRTADDAVPSSLGQGVHSSGPVDATEKANTGYKAPGAPTEGYENPNVEAAQLETFAEGKVADAVDRKSGTQKVPGQEIVEEDFASGLERKKQEQERAREAIKDARREGVDVDGGFGTRLGNEDNRDV
ncbi:hypothetical protein Cob_v007461 [Colletotrichum orbiculare MAFF 240422]|uniref:Uncharacterized protein n=2 Tax=Colletotrichum orbiculare species complex TaxID=2707354 RepID=N4V4J6_COLOR|nr:hypothetical protein Cob_v007461 [Colletotrichum orbiculare MAFF 240422]TDZ65228.1 hypothetical protein CTRI78_v003485 [Colletotrichum trifolii]